MVGHLIPCSYCVPGADCAPGRCVVGPAPCSANCHTGTTGFGSHRCGRHCGNLESVRPADGDSSH